MANRTASYAKSIHGTNPQYLIEKIIRSRIYDCKYWKEHCTLLTSALVLEKAVDDLNYVGGTFGGNVKPTPFLCLVLKLLQIQPKKEIIYFFLEQPEFKYLRALAAFYLRLVGDAGEIYCRLEPLLRDYRKLRYLNKDRKFGLTHMDELVEKLLNDERVCDIALPRILKRSILERNGDLGPYDSALDENDPDLVRALKIQARKANDKKLGYQSSSDEEASPTRAYSPPGKTAGDRPKGETKFSQEEIDKENAIRARVGLCPLKW